jgi:pimeloyl-ACP methyl ester carboxylesterase
MVARNGPITSDITQLSQIHPDMANTLQNILLIVLTLVCAGQGLGQSSKTIGSNDGKYVRVFDAEIYYEIYGEGYPLLLLHGGLGSIADFDKLIPGLSQHFQLIAIDSPGHGRSQHVDSLSYQIIARYIVELISKLDLEEAGIVGYSDGAIAGMLVAHMVPDIVKKLVFSGGALSPHDGKPEGLEMLRTIRPDMLPEQMAVAYKEKSPNPDRWEEFVYFSKDMWLQDVWIPEDILPGIETDVLILFGDRDQYVPLEHALEIYRALPLSELCVLPDLQHDVFKHPKLVQPVLIDFLSN